MEFILVLQILVGFCLSDGGWVKLPVTARGFAKWRKIEAESFDLDGT